MPRLPYKKTPEGETSFDVRIMELYGRERTLVEFRKVTKREALTMIGAMRSASLACSGEHTWVAPAIFINSGNGWKKQPHEVWRAANEAWKKHQEFWQRPTA